MRHLITLYLIVCGLLTPAMLATIHTLQKQLNQCDFTLTSAMTGV